MSRDSYWPVDGVEEVVTVQLAEWERVVEETPQRSDADIVESNAPSGLTETSAKLLSEIQGRFEPFDAASAIWQDYLTDRDRVGLGDGIEVAWQQHGTLGIVSFARKCSRAEALLWLCEQTKALSAARIRSLRRELGLPTEVGQAPSPKVVPMWNKARSELSFSGKVIRSVRRGVGHRIVAILDAFEADGWPDRIPTPVTLKDDQQMREAVYSLNDRLQAIHFRADGTGEGIVWERQ